jgi:glycosyltransferase involved in cell wall biosynthesis
MDQVALMSEKQCQAQRSTDSKEPVELTVVIPISEGHHADLRQLYLQVAEELSTTSCACDFIFVLDGPDHEALQTLKVLKEEHPEIMVLTLNRRFGEATALSVAFEKARGSIIVTLAPHFQVEPHEVHRMLKKLVEDEYDLVSAWRYPRIDSLFNRAQSRVFHWLIKVLTGTRYHDISCGLRVMKRQVAEEIHLYGDLHRFFPLLAYQRGFRTVEIPVQQSGRDVGRRVYGPGPYLRRLLDILIIFFLFKFTNKPLRFFGPLGSGLFGVGAMVIGYLGLYRLLRFGAIADRPLLMLGVLLMVFGIQLFSIGLLSEIIIFTHARDVREYQIKEILDE